MTKGQVAYDTYSEAAGGASLVTGTKLPEWKDLPAKIQEAWEAAAKAVLGYGVPSSST